jgi:hypothetical protein
MQSLLLFKPDSSLFDDKEVERIFRSNPQFKDIRVNTPWDLIECKYIGRDGSTIITLSADSSTISMNYMDAALQAALQIQKALRVPLQMVNSSYTFDLTFSDISTVEELEAAMDNSPTS